MSIDRICLLETLKSTLNKMCFIVTGLPVINLFLRNPWVTHFDYQITEIMNPRHQNSLGNSCWGKKESKNSLATLQRRQWWVTSGLDHILTGHCLDMPWLNLVYWGTSCHPKSSNTIILTKLDINFET